jgi:hypothetical protein
VAVKSWRRWSWLGRAGALISALVCLDIAQAAPSPAPARPSPRQLKWLGAWSAGERGTYALLTPGMAVNTFTLRLYATTPRALAELPIRVSVELVAGTQSVQCWTPLRDCAR